MSDRVFDIDPDSVSAMRERLDREAEEWTDQDELDQAEDRLLDVAPGVCCEQVPEATVRRYRDMRRAA